MKNSSERPEWLIIVNPNAGKGKGKKDWDLIAALLQKYNLLYSVKYTEKKMDAAFFAKEGIEGGNRNIIVMGGDGTLNEVVNGVFTQKACNPEDVTIGMIPVGTGNDWGRMFGLNGDYENAVRIICDYNLFLHDTGVITFPGGADEKRYFINIAGLGFDAAVVKRTNAKKDKGRSGKLVYMINLLLSLIGYRSCRINVVTDGTGSVHDTFTISIGIGRFSGGGMKQTPFAVPDDGLFDITVIGGMSKPEIILNLGLLYNGKILSHPKIKGLKARNIKISSDQTVFVEADGESVGHTPVEFNILPKSIKIVSGIKVIQ